MSLSGHGIRIGQRSRALASALLLLAAAFPGETARLPELRPIDPPAAPGSRLPALAAEAAATVTQEHEILLTWLEPGPGGSHLYFSRLSAGGWSPPVTIAAGVAAPPPGDPPSLTVLDTQGVRRTLIARSGDVVARTGNAGRTWSRLPAPPLPFASFAGGHEGGFGFWLEADADGSSKLLGTRILAGRTILDPKVAGGAGPAAAMTWDGPVLVYLDEREDGALELAVIRRQDARWTEPRALFVDSVDPFPGGLDGGLRVAAEGRRLVVAWKAAGSPGGRWISFSDDAGRSFGEPFPIAPGAHEAGRALGAPELALDENGDALLLWLGSAGSRGPRLYLRRVVDDGRQGRDLLLAEEVVAGPGAGPPRVVRAASKVAVAWAEGGASGRLRALTLAASSVPAAEARPSIRQAPSHVSSRPYSGHGRVGETVPSLEVRTLEGTPASLPSLQGKVVVLNFWATWCLPCIAEMPELAEVHHRYRDQGLEVLTVSTDPESAAERVRAFVAERQLPFTVWVDPERVLYQALRLKGLPVTFVVDRKGRILLRRNAPITAGDPQLRETLSRALGGAT